MTIRKNHIARRIRGVQAAGEAATNRAAQVILDEAKRRTRVGKTHAIRDGLRIRVLTAATEGLELSLAVGVWGVREAGFNERGTVHLHAQPYLRPGALLGRRTLKKEAEDRVRTEAHAD